MTYNESFEYYISDGVWCHWHQLAAPISGTTSNHGMHSGIEITNEIWSVSSGSASWYKYQLVEAWLHVHQLRPKPPNLAPDTEKFRKTADADTGPAFIFFHRNHLRSRSSWRRPEARTRRKEERKAEAEPWKFFLLTPSYHVAFASRRKTDNWRRLQ